MSIFIKLFCHSFQAPAPWAFSPVKTSKSPGILDVEFGEDENEDEPFEPTMSELEVSELCRISMSL